MFIYTSQLAIEAFHNIFGGNASPSKAPITVFLLNLPTAAGKRIIRLMIYQADYSSNDHHAKRDLLVKDGWKISDLLKTDWDEIAKDNEEFRNELDLAHDRFRGRVSSFALDDFVVNTEPKSIDDTTFLEEGLTFFRIVANTILYLASNDPSVIPMLSPHKDLDQKIQKIKAPKKRRHLLAEATKTSVLDFNLVGRELGRIVAETIANPQLGQLRRHACRFIVRGHWRNQPYGESLANRKLIWIKPYWKGPDMGQLVSRPYVVQ
jgi:hypothetical protein